MRFNFKIGVHSQDWSLQSNHEVEPHDWSLHSITFFSVNSNEFEQILQSYSKYYGNHKHPRILRRLWFWLGILLLKKFSSPSTTTTKVLENLNILLQLLYRRVKIIKSYLQSGN